MAVYAVGDVQGCLVSLNELLDQSPIDLKKDQLWFVGDLVNRGPYSLETLRFVKSLGSQAKVVLGNHDLHLLALGAGIKRKQDAESLQAVLDAPDCEELLDWLRNQPLMLTDKKYHVVMVHAGVYPTWGLKQAQSYADEVQAVLQGERYKALLKKMYGRRPNKWDAELSGWARYRFIINAFTRMRFCTKAGGLNFTQKGPPESQSRKLYPWYRLAYQPRGDWRIVYGHWSAAGHWYDGNHIALDSGCLWGGKMTMARIDARKIKTYQVTCSD